MDLKELKMEKNKALRALVVAPTPTWPLNYGNRKRIYSVCSKLQSLGFEIHYVHYASEGDWRDYIPIETRKRMDEQWDIVDHVWPSKPLRGDLSSAATPRATSQVKGNLTASATGLYTTV